MMGFFPDLLHIERIRTALWRQREYGRASVMIGAGFSLNGQPISPSVTPFPTWGQLAERMVNGLHPPGSLPDSDRKRVLQQASSTSGALRLAEEYEAAFGRDALDEFLLSAIPDSAHEPSALHELLLKLPWSDVLTTNYDTLLERATKRVVGRKYDLVTTPADIPGALKPRIVKLHGSFPATRPFIFTEEDFRSYPRRFAPFVNLAQQVAMETVLCLIGFSGDDPNFLYWTGWVRDNLGRSAPQIYLCGLLNLNTAQRNLLHDRNVVPVDLSPLFPTDEYPDTPMRQRKAVEWLLLSFEAGQPASNLWWPSRPATVRTPPSTHMPPILNARSPADDGRVGVPQMAMPVAQKVDLLTKEWRKSREQYPGWLIAPRSSREILFLHSEFVPTLMEVPLRPRLEFLFELVWRLETCFRPLDVPTDEVLQRTLEEFNPYPHVLKLPDGAIPLSAGTSTELDWEAARLAWVSLGFAVLRSAREDQDLPRYELWRTRLSQVREEEPHINSPLQYEECLFGLYRLDHERVRAALAQWVGAERDPIWAVRRASVLAEIGDLEKALALGEQALTNIRLSTRRDIDDVAMLSREGWAMMLMHGLQFASHHDNPQEPEFRSRWEKLTEYRCNPNVDWDVLSAELRRPVSRPLPPVSEEVGVDGIRRRSIRIGGNRQADLLAACEAIRLVEVSGYLPSCGNVSLGMHVFRSASEWLAAFSPKHAAINILRTLDAEAVNRHFDPRRVALLSGELCRDLRALAAGAVKQAVINLRAPVSNAVHEIAINHIRVSLILLGALLQRLVGREIEEELGRAIELYGERSIRSLFRLADPISDYLRRAIEECTQEVLDKHAFDIFSLPMPGVADFVVSLPDHWPEPLSQMHSSFSDKSRDPVSQKWDTVVQDLLVNSENPAPHIRQRAIMRLFRLHEAGTLKPSETERFRSVLWAKIDPRTGLPSATGLNNFAFLGLPEPIAGMAANAFRKCYANSKVTRLVHRGASPDGKQGFQIAMGVDRETHFDNIRRATKDAKDSGSSSPFATIDWSTEEAKSILAAIAEWWDSEGKEALEKALGGDVRFVMAGVHELVENVLATLAEVVVPRINPSEPEASVVRKLFGDARALGFRGAEVVLPLLLRLDGDQADDVADKLRQGLVAQEPETALGAIKGLYNWLDTAKRFGVPGPPADLVQELGRMVGARRQPRLDGSLLFAKAILEEFFDKTDSAFVQSLIIGIKYLIEETKYADIIPTSPSGVSVNELVEYRRLTGNLAGALMRLANLDSELSQKWTEVFENDPLNRVREGFRLAKKGR